jgi:RHS repeat-associated protein
LKSVVLADGTLVAHTYDADGVRVRTETTPPGGPTEVVDYLVDTSGALSHVVAETDASGALKAYYVRGDDLLAVIQPVTWVRFYHADGQGSIRALTDDTEAVTDRWSFTAFGELLEHVGNDENAYLFAGEMLDANSRLYYNRARWMDPGVGRFVSLDRFDGWSNDPPTLHKYLYARSNPLTYIDPTGLESYQSLTLAMATLGTLIGNALMNFRQAIWSAQYTFSNVAAWRWTSELLRAARAWASGAGVRLQAALEVAMQFSRGRIDVVLRTADRTRRVAVEAKNWNLDILARRPESVQLSRMEQLVDQAQRYVAPGELAAEEIVYAFPRAPTTVQGIQLLQRITAELNRLNIERIAVGLEGFVIQLRQVIGA